METLALIETLDRDGQPRQILRVSQWPVRIGRAIDCDLVLDDPHVAAHHAALTWRVSSSTASKPALGWTAAIGWPSTPRRTTALLVRQRTASFPVLLVF